MSEQPPSSTVEGPLTLTTSFPTPKMRFAGQDLEITLLPLADIKPDKANSRRHSQKNLKAVADSLRHFGQVEPLVLRADTKTLIGGHARFQAMQQMGWEKAWCVLLPANAKKAKALGVALNRSHDLSEFDQDMLRIVAGDLKEDGWDLSELGFDSLDQAALFKGLPDDQEEQEGEGAAGGPKYQVVVECRSASEQDEILHRMAGIDISGKAVTKGGR